MKNKGFLKLLENNRSLTIFSFLAAIVCWFSVQVTQNVIRKDEIKWVPITVAISPAAMADLGLNPIDAEDHFATVTVRGPNTVVGKLTSSDFELMANISNVSKPATYDLPLYFANQEELSAQGIEIDSIEPSVAHIRFDRLVTRTFDIEPIFNGVVSPPHYYSEPEKATPSKVTVTGPQADLDKIERAIITAEVSEALTKTYVSPDKPIQLLNAQGDAIDTTGNLLVLDIEQAQLMVRVLKVSTLPLAIDFTNKPLGFPIDELQTLMNMSHDEITIAGPPDLIEKYSEIPLGFINLKKLSKENNSANFNIELPSSQLTDVDSIANVTVEFDSSSWDSAVFNIDSSNINVLNAPNDFAVSIITKIISDVNIVGNSKVISDISAGDIVATIDLSERDVHGGQYDYPVNISIPNKGLVWAVGEYSVLIQVHDSKYA